MEGLVNVTVLSATVNNVIVHCEGRRHPGLVVQGDRLHEWLRLARREDSDSRAVLLQELEAAVAHYDHFSTWRHGADWQAALNGPFRDTHPSVTDAVSAGSSDKNHSSRGLPDVAHVRMDDA
jgi:hypothetical protein